ncbi:PilW family protein [Pseudoalteromonas sp. T1lg10]|uniref:PilW family protein n=1 Tax=Pseudoalteromonas sp. T1lg10 TaxID=2077093 RepID=UPI000CF65EA7|nr:PilW family protein [Pseudoalteromonas sp. T1lg10]
MDIKHSRFNRIAGYTLLELMIAMVVGLFLLGGVMFTYLSMKVTTSDTVEMGELQETGRIALDILGKDLKMTGFFGRLNIDSLTTADVSGVTAPAVDCIDEVFSIGSFPGTGAVPNFPVIYGLEADSANELGCITDAKIGSDVIQIKRGVGEEMSGQDTQTGQYYVQTTLSDARFIEGDSNPIPFELGKGVWPYEHLVYYVGEDKYTSGGKEITVPVLKRKRLIGDEMDTESVLEGVENIRFLYGLDNDGNGDVDEYLEAGEMTPAHWQQSGTTRIKTVQVSVLVRATKEDNNIKLTNQTYVLGGDDTASGNTQRKLTFDDNYRRMVFVSTFKINNAGGNQWLIAL